MIRIVYTTHNPQTFFFSTNQAADKLRATGKFDAIKTRVVATLPKEGERFHSGHRGIHVQLLNIHHGRSRPIENLGFIVEIAGNGKRARSHLMRGCKSRKAGWRLRQWR